MSRVHIAVMRQAKPGREAEFEAALCDFARRSMHAEGMTGVLLLAPVPGTRGHEFGILRSFIDEAASRRFYESPLFTEWDAQVADLVVGPAQIRPLNGLEAFFRDPSRTLPPRWKMALVTWIGVVPAVGLWSTVLPRIFTMLPMLAIMMLVNAFVVATLTWIVMPLLTKLLESWLHGRSFGTTERN